MPKLGLALSSGGFRATLYHLGVVRFLRDAGALQDVTDIASVSGGSILAAHLVLNWVRDARENGSDVGLAVIPRRSTVPNVQLGKLLRRQKCCPTFHDETFYH